MLFRSWSSFEALAGDPPQGVLLAHEVLDALAVERIVSTGEDWCQQHVALSASGALRFCPGPPLASSEQPALQRLGLWPPGPQRPAGWSTERHPGLEPWLAQAGAALGRGHLLVIDYALEAWRYYQPSRSSGTLLAYREQIASGDVLRDPGHWDLTAHLCLESLEAAALATGWQPLGGCRQGQALLALGLAERLHGLQAAPSAALPELLRRREALLRLVDPHALGEFRWQAFQRGALPAMEPLFLREPPMA